MNESCIAKPKSEISDWTGQRPPLATLGYSFDQLETQPGQITTQQYPSAARGGLRPGPNPRFRISALQCRIRPISNLKFLSRRVECLRHAIPGALSFARTAAFRGMYLDI